MEQEMVIVNDQPEEGASLGERYDLGALEATYHVSYTRGDVRRYRILVFFISLMIFCLLALIVLIVFMISDIGSTYHYWFVLTPFSVMFNAFSITYSITSRKWGNRPLMIPRDRHQRVYVYADGIVKQTDRSSEVVRWVDIFKITYVPLQSRKGQGPDTAKSVTSAGTAGINISLHGGKHLLLSGLLQNIEGLAYRLNHKRSDSSYQV